MLQNVKLFFVALRHWYDRDANIYAAALAYFAPFALIPMLAVAITLVGWLVGEDILVETLLRWGNTLAPGITPLIGDAVADFTMTQQYWGLPFVGLLVLLWVLLSTLSLLVRGLYHVWYIPEAGVWRQIELYLRSGLFFMLLLAFLTLVVALSIFAPDLFGDSYFGGFIHSFLVFLLVVGLFTVGFGMLVQNPLRLRSRLIGATTVAVLLSVLRLGFTWWLAFTPAIDFFGAAGVLLGLLILIYIMTSVVYYGAAVAYQFEQRAVKDAVKY